MSAPARPFPRAQAGIAFLVAAVACFSILDTTTKLVSVGVPVLMALWFRYAFQAIATTVAVLPKRGLSLLRTAHPKFQLLRGVLLLTTSVLSFFSLKYMPVGEFTAMVMITPLVITLLASLTLGERVSLLRWALVFGGFLGTLVIIRPGGDDFSWTMLLPLGLVISHAWFQILTSRLARTEDPVTMHFYTGWVGMLLASLALPFVWVTLDSWMLWAGLVLMGVLATVGHFMMILAYGRAPASTLTPFLYAQVGFAMLAGWLVFSHVPDRWSMLGIGMITVCGATGAWLAVRESRVSVEPLEG
ncbi:MAG: DMT family transporter [Polaromonas sp.]|nr:DMT family transporter [Polaromonas sp.]